MSTKFARAKSHPPKNKQGKAFDMQAFLANRVSLDAGVSYSGRALCLQLSRA